MKTALYKLDRDKVRKLIRTEDEKWSEQWICALHDKSMQTYVRRCRVGWDREGLIALASTISDLSGLDVKYTDLIDISEAGQ